MMTALTVTDVAARASLIESHVELVRLQIERNASALSGRLHLWEAEYQYFRLRSELNAALPKMPHEKISAIADKLEDGVAPIWRHVQRLDAGALNWFERWNYQAVVTILTKLNDLSASLKNEATKRRPYMPIAKESPTLHPTLYRDAVMASYMFHRAAPDPAERDPDPDYGF
jgi:hypothetical protein